MNKKLTKIVGLALGLSMAVGVGAGISSANNYVPVHADPGDSVTWTWTAANANKISATKGSNTLAGKVNSTTVNITADATWTGGSPGNYESSSYGGQQMGAASSNMTAFSLTFGNPWGGNGTYKDYTKITSISLSGSNGSSTVYTVSVTVDGTAASNTNSTTTLYAGTGSKPNTCTFAPASGHDSGVIVINVDKTSGSKAWYLTSISITAEIPGESGGPVSLLNPNPQYNDSTKLVSWTSDANATKYQIKVDDGEYNDIGTSTYNASSLDAGVEHTVYIKAVGDETNYTSAEGSVTFTPFLSKNYVLCSSTTDLEAGASYLITSGTSGTIKTMTTQSEANYRHIMDTTVVNSKVAIQVETLTLTLGGSSGAWTFHTENYLGTNGYLAPATGASNHLRVAEDEEACTISFDGDAAVITFTSRNDRNIIRYNSGDTRFSCYSTGQADVYLWREYTSKVVDHLTVTGAPSKTAYFEGETFDPTGITAYQAVYDDDSSKPVPASDIHWPDLAVDDTSIKGSYTERGTTVYTPTYTISVSSDSLASISLNGAIGASYNYDEPWDNGTLEVTAHYSGGRSEDVTSEATIAYYRDSSMTQAVATPNDLGIGENQTVYVKATYETVSNTVGYSQTVTVAVAHGTAESDPLTPDEAIGIAASLANNGETPRSYYVQGIISEVVQNAFEETYNNGTCYLQESNDTYSFELYRIKPEGWDHYEDFRVGAEVLVRCKLKKHEDTTIENDTTGRLLSVSYSATPLTGISLSSNALNLNIGEHETLTASPVPLAAELGDVTWTSSAPGVASVSNGTVNAVSAGSATITASAGGFEATCSVTVSEPEKIATYTVTSKTAASTTGYAPAGTTATYSQTYNTAKQATGGNSLTLTISGFTKATVIKGIKLSMRSNTSSGAGKLAYYIDGSTNAKYLVGSADSGVTFNQWRGNDAYSANYKDVVIGTNLGIVVNSSLKLEIAATVNSLYCESYTIEYEDKAKEVAENISSLSALKFNYADTLVDEDSYSNVYIRFGGMVSKKLWDKLEEENDIQGYGILVAVNDDLGGQTIKQKYAAAKNSGNTPEEAIDSICSDPSHKIYKNVQHKANPTPADDGQKTFMDVSGDYYIWTVKKDIGKAFSTKYNSVAFILIDGDIVFLEEVSVSGKDIADAALDRTNPSDPARPALSFMKESL